MKIIHIVLGKANPNRLNGVNVSVHNLATSQRRVGHDVEVWGITKTPNASTPKRDYLLKLFSANPIRFLLDWNLRRTIDELSPDVTIHFHGVFFPEFYAISQRLMKKTISWVISPHGAYNPKSIRNNYVLKKVYFILFDSYVFQKAKAIHVHAKEEIDGVVNWASIQKMVILPNGIELNAEGIKNSPLLNDRRPIFGYMGRLAKDVKGLDLLLSGFSRYIMEGGNGMLWVIGDGPDRVELEEQASVLGLKEIVKFFGSLFNEEKLSSLSQVDVFMHTSRWDAMPVAVLEAAALKRPLVISPEIHSLAHHIQDWNCGMVLAENNPQMISAAMWECEKKLKDNELQRLGENAYHMVLEEFNWKRIAQQMVVEAYQ